VAIKAFDNFLIRVVLNKAAKNDTNVQPVLIFSTLLIWIQRRTFFQGLFEFPEKVGLSPAGHFFGAFLSESWGCFFIVTLRVEKKRAEELGAR
jgi:hypothetical protein